MGKDLKGKELGVGISQRKDGLYTARFTDRLGKRRQQYFKKLQECRNWLANAQFQNKHRGIYAASNMTVNAWFDYWINEIKRNNVRESTKALYENRYKINIEEQIGNMVIADIKPLHCQNILNKMADTYSNNTIKKVRTILYSLFADAEENGLISKNPVTKSVKCTSGKKPKEKKVLSVDEHKAFLKVAKESSYYNQYSFILQTGLRIGELTALQWEDVDFKVKTIHVRHTIDLNGKEKAIKMSSTKTKAGDRMIPLTNEALRILKEEKKKRAELSIVPIQFSNFVFLNKHGIPTCRAVYNEDLYKYADKIGIERFSVHTLRHTFATRCIEAGMKPKTLQMILGHSNISMTMDLYVHVTEDEKEKELKNVEHVLKMV